MRYGLATLAGYAVFLPLNKSLAASFRVYCKTGGREGGGKGGREEETYMYLYHTTAIYMYMYNTVHANQLNVCTYMGLVFWREFLHELPGFVYAIHLPQLVRRLQWRLQTYVLLLPLKVMGIFLTRTVYH